MRFLISGLALATALALGGCEGMAPGGYGDMPDDPNIAAAGAAIPQLPQGPGIPPPPSIPRPPTSSSFPAPPTPGAPSTPRSNPAPASPPGTGGPLQTSRPPTAPPPSPAGPAPPAAAGGCTAPQISIRTEVTGAVEIKCGAPPMAPPAGMSCKAPEHLTWLTRNGVSNFTCMK